MLESWNTRLQLTKWHEKRNEKNELLAAAIDDLFRLYNTYVVLIGEFPICFCIRD